MPEALMNALLRKAAGMAKGKEAGHRVGASSLAAPTAAKPMDIDHPVSPHYYKVSFMLERGSEVRAHLCFSCL